MKEIAIFGAGGMGREVACVVNRINKENGSPLWNLVGFYDDGISEGTHNEFGKILGGIEALNGLDRELNLIIAIGDPMLIRRVHHSINNPKISYPNIIDPTVDFWDKDSLQIGMGNIMCPHCSISCNVKIGNFNIFNGEVSIRHDVLIENYNAFMPGVRISGGVKVGYRNFFGLNVAVTQYRSIGNNTRIGAGSIVMSDAIDDSFYIGVPAQQKELIRE
mgnify:CR=1 FL=1